MKRIGNLSPFSSSFLSFLFLLLFPSPPFYLFSFLLFLFSLPLSISFPPFYSSYSLLPSSFYFLPFFLSPFFPLILLFANSPPSSPYLPIPLSSFPLFLFHEFIILLPFNGIHSSRTSFPLTSFFCPPILSIHYLIFLSTNPWKEEGQKLYNK